MIRGLPGEARVSFSTVHGSGCQERERQLAATLDPTNNVTSYFPPSNSSGEKKQFKEIPPPVRASDDIRDRIYFPIQFCLQA